MTTDQPDDLFDLAILLSEDQRKILCELADAGDSVKGGRLRERLLEFENFKRLMENTNNLPHMIARLKRRTDGPAVNGDEHISGQGISKEIPSKLGQYRIESVINRGGQGTVFLAMQESTGRRVAVKLIHQGSALLPEGRGRFKRELNVLAMMNHDHIAAIYDADTTPLGMPFFSMEYVDGTDILTYCRQKNLSCKNRIELFIQACRGIAHAHQRLVLHRDLKPGNVLVTEENGKPRVKIVDFGLARGLDGALDGDEQLTLPGPLGTPGFMAPEMYHRVDPNTSLDIYSLGVLLYHLITGRPPLEPPPNSTLEEKWRYYRDNDPENPQIYRESKDDLCAIIMKALQRSPANRYGSVTDLERDCRRFLDGRPVTARPPSLFYRLNRFIARNKVMTGVTALVLLLLAFGLARVIAAERKAQKENYRFETSFQALERILAAPDPYKVGARARVIDVLRTSELDFGTLFGRDRELESMIRMVWGSTYYGLGFYEDAHQQLEEVVAIRNQKNGHAHIRTLEARSLLAKTAIRLGRYEEAEANLHQIYDLYPRTGLEKQRIDVLALLTDVFQARGEPERAKALLEQMRQITPAVDSQTRAQWLFALANIHHGVGSSEAEKLYRQSLTILSRTTEPNPKTLAVMGGLANHLRRSDRLLEAEALYRRLIDTRSSLLGDGHYLTQYARAGLALCLADQKRHEEAGVLITGVAETLKRRDAGHPKTLTMIRLMATVLRKSGETEKPLQLLHDLAAYYRENELNHSLDALKVRSNLADLMGEKGEYQQAVELLGPMIEDSIAALGQHHTTTIAGMMTLGQIYEKTNDHQAAEAIYKEAIELLASSRPESRELPYYQAIRANNLTDMKRYDKAEPMLLESLAASAPKGFVHNEIRTWLARHYRARGDEAKAAVFDKP